MIHQNLKSADMDNPKSVFDLFKSPHIELASNNFHQPAVILLLPIKGML